MSHKELLLQEFNWTDHFHTMASKNNIKVHSNYQEYFDRPIDYDVRGYSYSQKGKAFKVYEAQTPIVTTLKSSLKRPMRRNIKTANSPGRPRLVKGLRSMRSTGDLRVSYFFLKIRRRRC